MWWVAQCANYSCPHEQWNYQWCFSIDLRSLNAVSPSKGCPIPQIAQLLQCIGQRGAKLFCFGPHGRLFQITVAELYNSAFIQMARSSGFGCQLGLKGATSHFRSLMVTVVLARLMYVFCRVHLDDIVAYDRRREKCCEHNGGVRQISEKHQDALNPAKCKFSCRRGSSLATRLSANACPSIQRS